MRLTKLLLFALAGSSLGCPQEASRFRAALDWPSLSGPPDAVYVSGRIVLGGGGSVSAGPVGPSAYGEQVRLSFASVPFGRGHRLFVEVSETPGADVLLLFGASAPFDFEPGESEVIRVQLGLESPPVASEDNVRIETRGGFVNAADVRLTISSTTAVVAELSNRSDFAGGGVAFDLAEAEGSSAQCPTGGLPSGACVYTLNWDLERGLAARCVEQDRCDRTAFVRLRNAEGIASNTYPASVVLDTRAPELVGQDVSPSVAGLEDEIIVRLSFQELLRSGDVELRTSLSGVEIERLFPASTDAEASNISFVLRPAGGRWTESFDAQAAGLRVVATDRAGNVTEPPLELLAAPQLDGDVPQPLEMTLAPSVLGADVRSTTLSFLLEESRLTSEVSIVTSLVPDGDGQARGALSLDGEACAVTAEGDGARFRWSCPLDFSDLDLSGVSTVVPVSVRVTDPAFNVGAAAVNLAVDFEPPSVARGTVLYVPSAGNPLGRVDAATDGTEVVLDLTFSEPVREDASLFATSGTSTLVFTVDDAGPDPAALRFRARVDASLHGDDVYAPRLRLTDLIGNEAETSTIALVAGRLQVDTRADALLVDQTRVSFLRSPFGNGAAEDLEDASGNVVFTLPSGHAYYALAPFDPLSPVATLDASTFSFDGADEVRRIRVYADPLRQRFLGAVDPRGDGAWDRNDLRLVNQDAGHVYVDALDSAGNASDLVSIETNWFVGSSASPIGQTSPHRVETWGREKPPLLVGTPSVDDGVLDAPDGTLVRRRAELQWRERGFDSPPADIVGYELGFDAARGEVILYGARRTPNGFEDLMWTYDGLRWEELSLANGPPPRITLTMAYDSRRGRLVVVGGTGAGAYDDVWEWDGLTWRDVTPAGPYPPGVSDQNVVYDSVRGRIVVHGGAPFPLDTVWEWDGRAWHPQPKQGPWPEPHIESSAAFDYLRGEMVMVGGDASGRSALDSLPLRAGTWTYDGAWVQSSSTSPTADQSRRDFSAAFHGATGEAILFGGQRGPTRLGDTLAWNGAQWRNVGAAHPGPSARFRAELVYDSRRERTVLFGGGCNCADTWEWDGARWHERTPNPITPVGRRSHQLVYDSVRGRIVLFGGFSPWAGGARSDLWAFESDAWTELDSGTGGDAPSQTAGVSLAFDRRRNLLIAFGGQAFTGSKATWAWDGSGWRILESAADSPPERAYGQMVYDEARDEIVLFGGRVGTDQSAETWILDEDGWRLEQPLDSPPKREALGMAYDARREVVVLFGGLRDLFPTSGTPTFHGDVWEWDGTNWIDATPGSTADAPTARAYAGMTYDLSRERVVIHGGYWLAAGGLRNFSDTWAWDGVSWELVTEDSGIPNRFEAVVAYDEAEDRVVLFGGADLADTWELVDPNEPPVAQLSVALPPEVTPETIEVASIRAYCVGGVDGTTTATTGAELLGWVTGGLGKVPGAWEVLADHDEGYPYPGTARAELSYVTTHSTDAEWLIGPDANVYVQCRSKARAGDAEIGLDYAEVRVRYASP